jgi:putative PIN family toxin of toxin-antitoxin system
VRAVLDVNVFIFALLSPRGSPGRVLSAWLEGAFELIVSDALLDELVRALGYPKLRKHINDAEVIEFVDLLRRRGEHRDDPTGPAPIQSSDPDDDYVIALAAAADAVIVSGDRHLLDLGDVAPVYKPAAFLDLIERSGS